MFRKKKKQYRLKKGKINLYKNRKFNKIILVTSAYHMARAVFLFRRTGMAAGLKIIPYPVDFKGNNHYNFYSFLPNLGNLVISAEAVHEYLGYVWARVKLY
ncbi:MAG: YdcF family protein [bacterium]